MALIQTFEGKTPSVGDGTFVAANSTLVGDVIVGARSSIWYGAVLRGDVFHIRIGDEVSIQDQTVIHVTGGMHATSVGNRVTVGHSVILHGCTVEDSCIIGMGAVVMDEAVIGKNTIVGAGALVTPGTVIPSGHLAVGSPARAKRKLTAEELMWVEASADHYVELAGRYLTEIG